ncbi:MAG: hypothetical protein MUF49_09510 [Oculatellaceae cyanobacterium Prado106]|jgi:hypothetical protein|nr:hypothetical protein [Oculatellaceae cyanobacterium Prado106]
MNSLLEQYIVDTEFSDVSGAEHLEMLQIRDRLFQQEGNLSSQEKERLAQADRRLIENAATVFLALSQFVDLADQRKIQEIGAERWWWYLDVLAQMMNVFAIA